MGGIGRQGGGADCDLFGVAGLGLAFTLFDELTDMGEGGRGIVVGSMTCRVCETSVPWLSSLPTLSQTDVGSSEGS
jgi:hypothetical protein